MLRCQSSLSAGVVILLTGLVTILAAEVSAQEARLRPVSNVTSQGIAVADTAARNGKYVFLYFWKDNDQQTQSMYQVFRTATAELAASAVAVGVNIADPREEAIVARYGVSRAPMPLVLAVAPNGAVTKAWSVRFTQDQLREGFVTPGTAKCMKALQDRKLVLLCVQHGRTAYASAALRGVRDFKADARFASAAEIVTIDSQDQSEAAFLRELRVDPHSSQAVTVVLAPPGKPVARFTGPVSKDQIVAKVTGANSSCCPGGQCCPGGKCGPQQ